MPCKTSTYNILHRTFSGLGGDTFISTEKKRENYFVQLTMLEAVLAWIYRDEKVIAIDTFWKANNS